MAPDEDEKALAAAQGADRAAGFLVGANLPWLEYGQDFGRSAWRPQGGVSRPDRRERLRRELDRLARSGARVVRWWLLGDGRTGLVESPSGRSVALDETVLLDLDAGVECLREAGLQAILVVMDFLWLSAPRLVDGMQLGGRRHLVRDAARRAELMETVFAPIASRHRDTPTIFAWDLFNEPEWATLALGTIDPRHSLSRSQMRDLLADLARTFRSHATQPLTVGCASARWLPFVEALDLDLLQVHWYEAVDKVAKLRRPLRRPGRRPLLLGEFPTSGASLSPAEIAAIAREAGYSGALAWSLLATDHATDAAACLATLLPTTASRDGLSA